MTLITKNVPLQQQKGGVASGSDDERRKAFETSFCTFVFLQQAVADCLS